MSKVKKYIRHFHLHDVACSSITVYAEEDENFTMKVSWAICAPEDNFSRKKGVTLAKNNMSHSVYVEGERQCYLKGGVSHPIHTVIQDILNVLKDGGMPSKAFDAPRKNPAEFRQQVIREMEDFHLSEAFLHDYETTKAAKKSFYWDSVLPILFKSKVLRRYFWGKD